MPFDLTLQPVITLSLDSLVVDLHQLSSDGYERNSVFGKLEEQGAFEITNRGFPVIDGPPHPLFEMWMLGAICDTDVWTALDQMWAATDARRRGAVAGSPFISIVDRSPGPYAGNYSGYILKRPKRTANGSLHLVRFTLIEVRF